MLTSEVRDWQGAPALFINGEAHTGLMFWHTDPHQAGEDFQRFARAGIALVTIGIDTGLVDDGRQDFAQIDAAIGAVLAAHPKARILPRIHLDPPDWWLARYPEEAMQHLDPITGAGGINGGGTVSFASARWRREFGAALHACIAHIETYYGEHILGYQPGVGHCGECSYAWGEVISDYSAPQVAAYRAWLTERYDSDAALRTAWGDAAITRATATIPQDRVRRPRQLSLLDPATERRLVDYLTFHSEILADVVLHFVRTIKEALAARGARKIVGVFYGYHFWDIHRPSWFHNSGHHALLPLLASPDIDFLCAPYTYQERHPGGMFLSQLVAGSARVHGKLFYSEDDTRTWLTPPDAAYGRCPDLLTTQGVLKRNFAGVLAAGGTQWWMDLGGTGWYRDNQLMDTVAALRGLAERQLAGARTPTAQVAVIVSKSSARYHRQDAALIDALLPRQLSELAHSGMPFDTYLADDLERVFAQPWSARYRLIIFADTLYLSPEERRVIREQVACDGRTLLWNYAAGLVTAEGFSSQAMEAVMGIRLHLGDPQYGETVYPLLVETNLTGERLAYGTNAPIGPIVIGDDPQAEVWGWLLHPHAPGLLYKELQGWQSIWSAVPGLPSALLRTIARHAGVHVYSTVGDQVMTAPGLLAVHAACDGVRTIRLPRRATLADALTGASVGTDVDEVTLTLRAGDTALWSIKPE